VDFPNGLVSGWRSYKCRRGASLAVSDSARKSTVGIQK
jgi:hypothetical protein